MITSAVNDYLERIRSTYGIPPPTDAGSGEIDIIRGTQLTRTNPSVEKGVEYVPGFDPQTGRALEPGS